jgi:hypothetical protein
MKLLRYAGALVAFALGWLIVAGLMVVLLGLVFPRGGTDHNVFGDWRTYPGSVLGLLFGYWVFRIIAPPRGKQV